MITLKDSVYGTVSTRIRAALFRGCCPSDGTRGVRAFSSKMVLSSRFNRTCFIDNNEIQVHAKLRCSFRRRANTPASTPFRATCVIRKAVVSSNSCRCVAIIHPRKARVRSCSRGLPCRLLRGSTRTRIIHFSGKFANCTIFRRKALPKPIAFTSPYLTTYDVSTRKGVALDIIGPSLTLCENRDSRIFSTTKGEIREDICNHG